MVRIVLPIVCLLLACSLAGGQDSLKPKEAQPDSGKAQFLPEPGPKDAFKAIAKAWQEGKAESIALFLGEGRVTISLPRVVGGVLSRDQAEYVLRDMFKFSLTEKFEFTKYDEFVSPGTVGIAEWSYRAARGGTVTKDRISVWLVKEGRDKPRWVIKEIKQA